jgi:hypothetical protein
VTLTYDTDDCCSKLICQGKKPNYWNRTLK